MPSGSSTPASLIESIVTVVDFIVQVAVIVAHGIVPSPVIAGTDVAKPDVTVQQLVLSFDFSMPTVVAPIELSMRTMMS